VGSARFMALIIDGASECSLCGSLICEGDDIVASSDFIDDEYDPLSEFSDAPTQRACFLAWQHRQEFVEK
jgi:hypothetical protein